MKVRLPSALGPVHDHSIVAAESVLEKFPGNRGESAYLGASSDHLHLGVGKVAVCDPADAVR